MAWPWTTRFPSIDEYRTHVLPLIVAQWQQRCFCAASQFCKLVSFNFEDYRQVPAALIDAEFLIDAIIRKHFDRASEPISTNFGIEQIWRCPQCRAEFRERYNEYSISLDRSFAKRTDQPVPAVIGRHVLGFHGFAGFNPSQIRDFAEADSLDAYLECHATGT